jgi:hypothetical protein
MAKKQVVWALCAIMLLSLLAACQQTDDVTPDVAQRRPFSLDIAGGDGAEVSWQGYTDGYRPGTTETMQLAVRNNADQPWKGRLCVQLLEPQPSSAVISLVEEEFDLEPGGGFARELLADLPADLSTGTYGLALVVHKPAGPSVSVTHVRVGEGEREPFQGEWPTAAALEACPAPQNTGGDPAVQPVSFQERFEGSLNGWQQDADVPEDPERPGQPVFWSIEISPDQAAEGSTSARFTLDGKQDDGTIWLARPLDVAADAAFHVQLAFDFWSESESFNTLANVAAYAGSDSPTGEQDFVRQPANLVSGWKTYTYGFDVRSSPEGQVWVALGISAVWETEMTYYVDNVRVEITPAVQGQSHGGRISIEGVEVTDAQVAVRGTSTLPDEACVSAELWADGVLQAWWPTDACASIQEGQWALTVLLEPGQALESGVQYMLRAYQPGGPDIVSTFPFDLDAPPLPPAGEP